MTFQSPKAGIALVACLVISGATIALAQNALAQFKVTEAEARDTILDEMSAGVGGHMNRPVVDTARKAFEPIPASARGPATTAIYAWTRTYINSPAFKTAYAAYRKVHTPVLRQHTGTVDEAVKRKVDEERAQLDKSVKDLMAAGMKAQADAMRQQAKMFDDKMYLQSTRMQIEETRERDKKNDEIAMAIFNERLPVNPMDSIAPHLRAFLAATPDVDFAATQKKVPNSVGGFSLFFVNDAYNKKPWQWRLSYEFGADAIAAARAAAAAWLKEAGK